MNPSSTPSSTPSLTQAQRRYGNQAQLLSQLQSRIQHVFVLMLENRSFDHLFACSGIPGIVCASAADHNSWQGEDHAFAGGAPDPMSSDPGHEFTDVLMQLTQTDQAYVAGQTYPARHNGGFVQNYATTTSEGPRPDPSRVADVMKGVETATQVPALYTLARNFALCDHWFSSLPGPTWPNRYFLHGASSSGLDDSPTKGAVELWESVGAFRYPNGSIFDALGPQRHRIYHDETGPLLGWIPQVASIENVHYLDIGNLDHFQEDLSSQDGYPYAYTFIEPSYGDVSGNTYVGGSSQHPMDGLKAADDLVRRVYALIRQSKVWPNSLLIVTYDEHGGFYDSVPPGEATPPGDHPPEALSQHGFDFSVYGVRVPAVVISPWIQPGVVDHTVYDHSSVLATLGCLFNLSALTQRDAAANDLLHLITDTCRSDCVEL